jgi:predicted dehydrogenase
MARMTRRKFLNSSLAAMGAGFAIGGTKSSGRVLGANDAVRVGIAGLHGRGAAHVDEYLGLDGVQITYLIDPDTRTFASRLKKIKGANGGTPRTVQDVREALDDKNLDAISIATPNHWHSLMTIWACQAGKDVYVEKPCSHNIHEGRIAVETARRNHRIVQHGTQGRSSPAQDKLVQTIQSGKLGKLLVSRGLCYKSRESIGFKPTSSPPPEVDFNIWLGPADEQPFHANLVHYNWHWFWPFGNGDIGNQGVHQMDQARWMIRDASLPKSVISLGGRFGYQDQGETPNTQLAIFDFGPTQLIFEVRGLPTDAYHGQQVGNIAHLEEGVIAGGKFYPKGSEKAEPLPNTDVEAHRGPGKGNFGNFIAAVRSRNQSDLNADILEGHYSAALCHLANISYRLGEQVPFNSRTKAFGDNKEAYETLARMEEHLSKKNGLKLDGLEYRLGRKLTVDPSTESFHGDADANKLLTRHYRKPFEVPDTVV